MKLTVYAPLFVFTVACLVVPCQAQTQPAPLYSLPADGTWTEYTWVQQRNPKKPIRGLLRISSVGQKRVDQKPHRWVEIKLTVNQDTKSRFRIRKLLIDETTLADGKFIDSVRLCFDKTGPTGRVVQLSPNRLTDFLGMGLQKGSSLRTHKTETDLQIPLGTVTVRYGATEWKAGPVLRSYHGWFTDAVPFGWAKFDIDEPSANGTPYTVFRAVAVRTGKNAQSEVKEVRTEK